MALRGPIVLIDDDVQDTETVITVLQEIGIKNEIRTFALAREAHDYLLTTEETPMIIFCDIKMTNLDGLSFRKKICDDPYLQYKSIPFVFLSGLVSKKIINEAYRLDIQGFFDKPGTYQQLKDHLRSILIYWQRAHHPTVDEED